MRVKGEQEVRWVWEVRRRCGGEQVRSENMERQGGLG